MDAIRAIVIKDDAQAPFIAKYSDIGLGPFKTLNIFCGPNNSGKSRAIRWIFSEANKHTKKFLINPKFGSNTESSFHDIIKNFRGELTSYRPALLSEELLQTFLVNRILDDRTVRLLLQDRSFTLPEGSKLGNADSTKRLSNLLTQLHADSAAGYKNTAFVYIPSVRTARAIGSLDDYLTHLVSSYFNNDTSFKPSIFTGRDLYDLVQKLLLGTPTERAQVAAYESFLSQYFFDSRQVNLSPRIGSKDLHIRIYPDTERTIANLGDGIQQIVIMFAPAFLMQSEYVCTFIEEPELYLHPGIQRRLLTIFTELDTIDTTKLHQFFISSHSNHLLDYTAESKDISIFRVAKSYHDIPEHHDPLTHEQDSTVHIEQISPGDLRVLGELGAKPSSVFLSNCTIWVEGPTDRTIIRALLDVQLRSNNLQDKILEDRDYSFVFYGGNLITNWSFLSEDGPKAERLCSEALVLCDRDNGKDARHKALKRSLGDNFYVLPCREIENCITHDLLCSVVSTIDANDIELSESSQARLATTPIGEYINELFMPSKSRLKWQDNDGGMFQKRKTEYANEYASQLETVSKLNGIPLKVSNRVFQFVCNKCDFDI